MSAHTEPVSLARWWAAQPPRTKAQRDAQREHAARINAELAGSAHNHPTDRLFTLREMIDCDACCTPPADGFFWTLD